MSNPVMGEEEQVESDEDEESRLWIVDPSMYQSSGHPKSLGSRVASRLRGLGTIGLFTLLIVYPVGLIYMGLVYGWLGFWGTFLGTLSIIGLVLHRAGYSGNFSQAGTGTPLRAIAGLFLAFIVTVGFYEWLFILRSLVFPIIILFVTIGLGYKLARS